MAIKITEDGNVIYENEPTVERELLPNITAESIPEDYTQLLQDVTELKNDLNQFPNGNYPQMGAGYANQLVSGLKKEDSVPYNFRKVPYDATLEEVKKIVGGTVVNNQLVTNGNFDGASGWSANPTFGTMAVANNKATLTITNQNGSAAITRNNVFITSNHVYVCFATFTSSEDTRSCRFGFANDTATPTRFFEPLAAGVRKSVATIIKPTSVSNSGSFYIYPKLADNGLAVGATFEIENVMVFDATLMLGSALADYAYNIDMSTAGAGVTWLKKNFPKQFDAGYQVYDAGSLQSVSGLTAHKMVGFNQWDEQWESGYINPQTGAETVDSTKIRMKNFVPVLPNTTYYKKSPVSFWNVYFDSDKNYIGYGDASVNTTFTTPNNCRYIRSGFEMTYGTTYNHDICINLSDPTKNGTYEPYEAHSYALDSDVVLRGIPKLGSNKHLYYDGDEYLPDGTVNRRYGIVDLGTLEWIRQQNNSIYRFQSSTSINAKPITNNETIANMICQKYVTSTWTNVATISQDKTIGLLQNGTYLAIQDDSYTDVSAFKTAMSGVYLVYEKATPTTETADPYITPQIISPDGTEEYIYEDGSFELPVGHASEYPVNVSGQLDDILDTPSANGTYVLKATVTDGAVSYSWVADA